MTNKEQIKELVKEMLQDSYNTMLKQVDKALNSGCLDVESWSKNKNPMIIPKIIITAILENESCQYQGKGTSFEKQVKKEVKNLKYFL